MYSTGEYSVLELNTTVKELLSAGMPGEFWIRGVVTGLRQVSGRGHCYFQLADPSPPGGQSPAVVDCALFAGDKAAITIQAGRAGTVFNLQNNTEVRIQARVNFWERSGNFQIVMKGMDHSFSGDSAVLHLQKLVEKLSKEGVLSENGTLEMTRLPLTIGLVTSKGSAAERDFLKTLEESGYPFKVYACWATMQGSDTADSVCKAFAQFLRPGVFEKLDALVLTRGGGSVTDLAWFNNEMIARTIAQLPWPVISAIGHEIDTTLPDHAAHTRAKTPTHAASLLVDLAAGFDETVSRLCRGLVSAFSPRIGMEKLRLEKISGEMASALRALPGRNMARLQQTAAALALAGQKRLHSAESNLSRLEGEVEMRDPSRMLELGWSIVRNDRGIPLKVAGDALPGSRINVSMLGGTIKALVEEVEND